MNIFFLLRLEFLKQIINHYRLNIKTKIRCCTNHQNMLPTAKFFSVGSNPFKYRKYQQSLKFFLKILMQLFTKLVSILGSTYLHGFYVYFPQQNAKILRFSFVQFICMYVFLYILQSHMFICLSVRRFACLAACLTISGWLASLLPQRSFIGLIRVLHKQSKNN